ncbi:MAG: hypothetical protein FJ009_01365 [Chloroflexi bacterium]|nr:hypothetical protein [Chloroflexota bacterium]
MSAVAVRNDLLNVAKKFGDIDTVISDALRRYTIDRCAERIEKARAKIREYEKKYSVTYPAFARRVQMDAKFLRRIETKNPVWEEDAMEWQYRIEEVKEWTETLERILKR